jgi:hypothetical protein
MKCTKLFRRRVGQGTTAFSGSKAADRSSHTSAYAYSRIHSTILTPEFMLSSLVFASLTSP